MSRQSRPRPSPDPRYECYDPDLDLRDDDALIEMASDKYGIVVGRDELDEFIPKDYVQKSLDTPIIDWAELIPRLQNQLEEDHRKSSSDGQNLKTRLNAQLMQAYENEFVFLDEEKDLNELISESDYLTCGRLIDVETEIRKFKEKNESENSPDIICLGSHSSSFIDPNQFLEITFDDEVGGQEEIDPTVPIRGRPRRAAAVNPTTVASSNPAPTGLKGVKNSPRKLPAPKQPSTVTSGNNSTLVSTSFSSRPKNHQPAFTSTPQAALSQNPVNNRTAPRLKAVEKKRPTPSNQASKERKTPPPPESPSVNRSSTVAETGRKRLNPEEVFIPSVSTSQFMFTSTEAMSRRQTDQNTAQSTSTTQAQGQLQTEETNRMQVVLPNQSGAVGEPELFQRMIKNIPCLVCTPCQLGFPMTNPTRYTNHVLTQHSVDLGGKTLEEMGEFNSVMMSIMYECVQCQEKMRKDLKTHRLQCCPQFKVEDVFTPVRKLFVARDVLQCGICPKACESRQSYLQHMKSVHQFKQILVDPYFRCANCLLVFENSVGLSNHAISCVNIVTPSAYARVELVKKLLFCGLCLRNHDTVGTVLKCYQVSGILRCLFCLHTDNNRIAFFAHLTECHGARKDEDGGAEVPCLFCHDRTSKSVGDAFQHVVATHYDHIVRALLRGSNGEIVVMPPPTRPVGPTRVTLNTKDDDCDKQQKAARSNLNPREIMRPSVKRRTVGITLGASETTTSGAERNAAGGSNTQMRNVTSHDVGPKTPSVQQCSTESTEFNSTATSGVPRTVAGGSNEQMRNVTSHPVYPSQRRTVECPAVNAKAVSGVPKNAAEDMSLNMQQMRLVTSNPVGQNAQRRSVEITGTISTATSGVPKTAAEGSNEQMRIVTSHHVDPSAQRRRRSVQSSAEVISTATSGVPRTAAEGSNEQMRIVTSHHVDPSAQRRRRSVQTSAEVTATATSGVPRTAAEGSNAQLRFATSHPVGPRSPSVQQWSTESTEFNLTATSGVPRTVARGLNTQQMSIVISNPVGSNARRRSDEIIGTISTATSGVSRTIARGLNTQHMRLVISNPVSLSVQQRSVEISAVNSTATSGVPEDSNVPMIKFITSEPAGPGDVQRVNILPPNVSEIPPGFELLGQMPASMLLSMGYRPILTAPVRPLEWQRRPTHVVPPTRAITSGPESNAVSTHFVSRGNSALVAQQLLTRSESSNFSGVSEAGSVASQNRTPYGRGGGGSGPFIPRLLRHGETSIRTTQPGLSSQSVDNQSGSGSGGDESDRSGNVGL